MNEMKYTAFISYRHGDTDEFAAKTLHRALESYHVPSSIAKAAGKKKIGRIFRDVDELPTSDSLYKNIEDALCQSRFLIVICTPRLKESQWCMREIELFIKQRGVDHVLAVLAEGEPEDSFPKILTQRVIDGQQVEVEPLAADIRGTSEGKVRKRIRTERLRLLAPMLGCEFDQLRQRARQRQKVRIGVAAGGVSAVAVAFLGMMATENQRLQKQVRQTQKAQSYLMSQYSASSYKADDPLTAALLGLEGLPDQLGNDRPFVGDSMSSLTTALQTYNYQKGYMPDHKVVAETLDSCFLNKDGSFLAYVDLNGDYEYHIHFYDTVKKEEVASFDGNPDINSAVSSKVKVAFLENNQCAIAGLNGIELIDLTTMEVLWEGETAAAVEVSENGSVLAAYDFLGDQISFYDLQGKLLSQVSWEADYSSAPLGLNASGDRYALILRTEEESQLLLIDPATGKTEMDLAKQVNEAERKELLGCCEKSGWSGNVLSFLRVTQEGEPLYTSYDADEEKLYETDQVVEDVAVRLDDKAGVAAFCSGAVLTVFDTKTGKEQNSYQAGDTIAAAVYCGDDRYEIACADGTLEYVDVSTDAPYCISSLKGDGTGVSRMAAGGSYAATILTNAYQVQLYKMNDKTTELTATLQRDGNEVIVLMVQNGSLICLNTSSNTYTVNADTLEVQTYVSPVSYLLLPNENTVVMDDYEGTYTMYNAQTGEEKSTISSDVSLMFDAAYLFDEEKHIMQVLDYDTGEVSSECAVPEDCVDAYKLYSDQVFEHDRDGDGSTDYFEVFDTDDKLIFAQETSKVLANDDLLMCKKNDSDDYIVYDLKNRKQVMQYPFGTINWCSPGEDGQYLFISTTDNGGYVLDNHSGQIVLTLPDVSTINYMTAYLDSPYFSLLYIEDSGSTRLDIYEKEHPESPIAVIPGGIVMNRKDQVLIYDGQSTIYAADVQTKERIYEQGLDFVGSTTLTERQKQEYHCQ